MKYSDFRQQIKSGDLLAWSTEHATGYKKILSTIVRMVTMSEYSHVGIAWVIGDRVFIVEAVSPLVRIYPLSNDIPFYHISMNIEMNDGLVAYLLSKVGEKYSYYEAIIAYFSRPSKNKSWQCAEFVNSFYEKAGLTFKDAFTPTKIVKAVLEYTSGDFSPEMTRIEKL